MKPDQNQICIDVIRCGSYRNRYRFWRHVEGSDVISASFLAFVGWIRHGL